MESTATEITFEQLPKAVSLILAKLEGIEKTMHQESRRNLTVPDRWFDIDELIAYLPQKPAKQTVYGWINNKLIPYHKNGKRVTFLKAEIDQWLRNGRKQTIGDIKNEVDQHLSQKKKRG